jgi:hypothetical protein
MAARMWGSAEYPKLSPTVAAARVLAGIEDGTEEILTDETAEGVHAALLKDARPFDAEMQKAWDLYARQRAVVA